MESPPVAEPLTDAAPSMKANDNDSKADPSARSNTNAEEERLAAISRDGHESNLEENAIQLSPTTTKSIVESSGQDNGDSTKNGKVSGLSELSKQLRVLQAKNQSQQVEISRLERQIRILSELQGVHVGDLRRALEQACSAEAFGELQHRVAQLEAQLEAATLQRQQPNSSDTKSASSRAQDEATSRKVAGWELRVGEMEEMEEKLRSEVKVLYSQLMDQQTRANRFESLYREQQAENERLNMDMSTNLTQTQQEMQAEKETLTSRALQADADLHDVKEKMALLDQQHESEQEQSRLRLAQFKARFVVQDERIYDLEQQLSSLYVAFDMLNEESNQDDEQRSFLLSSLHEADAQVARQVHQLNEDQSICSPGSYLDNSFSSSRDTTMVPMPPPVSPVAATNHSPSRVVSPVYSSPVEEPIHSGVLYVRGSSVMKKWKKRNAALYSRPDYHILDIQDDVRRIILRYASLFCGFEISSVVTAFLHIFFR